MPNITSIVDRHRCHMAAKFRAFVDGDQSKLPTLYWLPKLHQQPYKSCFIVKQRRSTDGTYSQKGQFEDTDTDTQNARYKIMSKSEFRGLSTDEKLVTMFETLTESSQTRVQKVEHRVEKLETSSRAYDAYNSWSIKV